jgi:hypothetical protein
MCARKSPEEQKARYYALHRDEILAAMNKRYKENAAYREATLNRAKQRYHEDPEYRAATIARAKERYRKLKEQEKKSESNKTVPR